MPFGLKIASLIAAMLVSLGSIVQAEDFIFHHEHILGTSLEIQLTADSANAAEQAESLILAEIERQAKTFSSYDADSELMRWQATQNQPQPVSADLFAILQASVEWQKRSCGAFNPATETLTKVWQHAANENRLPTKTELEAAVKQGNEKHWELNAAEKTATHLSRAPLSFNAIAKGHIVEAACNVAFQKEKGIRGLVINLGGDLRICGDAVKSVAIADPTNAAEDAPAVAKIFVNNAAVATSGNYRRGWQIGEKWHSHILDPRNGQPVENIVSATVIARSSATADALATICNVLPPHESVALVESQDAGCLLIARDGQQFKSAGWEQFEQPQLFRFAAAFADDDPKKDAEKKDKKKAVSELLELEVKIELSRPAGAQYRRPYVAVWLEDADEFPVRTGLLFMMTKGNGSNWHRDLLRWYRQDKVRRLADETKLIETISSASRGPGEYRAVFDGLDDNGQPLKPGKYMLFVEVAREHGTYQIIRQPLELGTKPIETTPMKSNVEIKSASFEYRKPAEKVAQ